MLNVHPHNKDNAIKTAAFAFELDKEINEKTIEALRNLYKENEEFKNDFPKENPLSSVKVQMGQGVQHISSSAISGVSYLRSETNPEWVLQIQGRTISINCNLYTRWDEVWGFARTYFEKVIKCFDNYTLVKIVVEYLDEFNISNTTDNTWIGELFQTTSPYIPNFVYDIDTPWHTHNGFLTEETNRRVINLINMSFVKINTTAGLLSMQTQHASSLYEPFSLDAKLLENIIRIIEHSHLENKKLLSMILSTEMLDAIKLKV